MLYSDVITDQISLLDCFYFLRYWTIGIVYRLYCIIYVYYTRCNVINFEINLIFLIKLFFCMNKKSRQKLKYFEDKKS